MSRWISQFSSVAQSCQTLCNPMNHSTPGLHHQLPEFTQTHVHWVSDAIQPSHPLWLPVLHGKIPGHSLFLDFKSQFTTGWEACPALFRTLDSESNEPFLDFLMWVGCVWGGGFHWSPHPNQILGGLSLSLHWWKLCASLWNCTPLTPRPPRPQHTHTTKRVNYKQYHWRHDRD